MTRSILLLFDVIFTNNYYYTKFKTVLSVFTLKDFLRTKTNEGKKFGLLFERVVYIQSHQAFLNPWRPRVEKNSKIYGHDTLYKGEKLAPA